MSTVNTVISGFYIKHFRQMVEPKNFLEREQINVLAPVSNGVVNPGKEFVLLDEDPSKKARSFGLAPKFAGLIG